VVVAPVDGWITPNAVTATLYLGNATDAHRIEHLNKLGVTHILNVSCMQNFWPADFKYLKIDILDSPFVSIRRHFERCNAFIDEAVASHGKCLVHCQMGLSRSPTLCVSWLMASQHMPLKEAYAQVFNARGVIMPNDGFFRQLMDYERELFGCNSVPRGAMSQRSLSQRCINHAADTETSSDEEAGEPRKKTKLRKSKSKDKCTVM